MENGSRVQVVSMTKHEKVKVDSTSVNKSIKVPSKNINVKSTSNVHKTINSNGNSDKKTIVPRKTEAEIKEDLNKMIEKHNREMLKLLED